MGKKRFMAVASVLAMTLAASAGCAKNEPAGDGVTTTEFVGEPATVGDEEFTPEQINENEKIGAHGSYGVGDFGEKNESGIREITYEFSYGDKWTIKLGDTSTLEVMEWGDSENAFLGGTVELNAEEVSKLQEIYEKHKLWRWDGYDRRAFVTDAFGFTFAIQYNDGGETNVKGYHVHPKGWSEFKADLDAWIEPLKDRIAENDPEENRIKYDDELIQKFGDILYKGIKNRSYSDARTVTCSVSIYGHPDVDGLDNYDLEEKLADEAYEGAFGFPTYLRAMYMIPPFHSAAYLVDGRETVISISYDPSTKAWTMKISNNIPGSVYYQK